MGRVFDVVAAAQAAGVAAVRGRRGNRRRRQGVSRPDRRGGLGDAFEHGTGHGVGLDIHEAPAVGPGSTAILAPGVVVTVEPGVYLPGSAGSASRTPSWSQRTVCRPLTAFPKEIAA